MLTSSEGLISITCGSNVQQEHFANPHQQAAHCTQCHAPSHCRPDTCTTLLKEKPREMLNVSEQSLVNVYCFSLFFGENVEQAKEMPMDLTISSHDTRRKHIAYHIVVAAMLIPLVFKALAF